MLRDDLFRALGWGSLISAVVWDSFNRADFVMVLVSIGFTSMIAYYVGRYSRIELPSHIARRKYLNIDLVIFGFGNLIVSIGAAENILSSSATPGLPFEIYGEAVFVAGILVLTMIFAGIFPKLESVPVEMARMPLPMRLFFAGAGTFLTIAGAIASIAVFNSWLLYSLPTTWTIPTEFMTLFILGGGIFSLRVAIRGKMRMPLGT